LKLNTVDFSDFAVRHGLVLLGEQKAGAALGVVEDRDFEECVSRALGPGQLLDEEGEEGDVVDNGLGDAAPRVADDGSVSELESQDDRGVDAVVEAGDDDHLCCGQAECRGGVGAGELLVAPEQGGHPGHGGSVSFQGLCHRSAVAGVLTP
jgi:hypothetical protein